MPDRRVNIRDAGLLVDFCFPTFVFDPVIPGFAFWGATSDDVVFTPTAADATAGPAAGSRPAPGPTCGTLDGESGDWYRTATETEPHRCDGSSGLRRAAPHTRNRQCTCDESGDALIPLVLFRRHDGMHAIGRWLFQTRTRRF